MSKDIQLVFVYNAKSGLWRQLTDVVHKFASPETYECNLCGLSYGLIWMKSEWKRYVKSLPYKTRFLHKDEFASEYLDRKSDKFPALYVEKNGNVSTLIGAEEINRAPSLDALIDLVEEVVSKL